MAKVSAILFDKDGTLFDFERTWANWAALFLHDLAGGNPVSAARLGHAVGFDLTERSFAEDSPLVSGTPETITASLLPHLPGASRASIIARMNALSAEAPQIEAAPLAPLLRSLRRRGLKLGVATNDAVGCARRHLDGAGVLDLFDMILGSDSGFGAKPLAGMPRAFAEMLALEPSQVVLVGDSRHDMEAARAAGMRGLAVMSGMSERPHVSPLAEMVLPSIAALPAWLDRQTPALSAA